MPGKRSSFIGKKFDSCVRSVSRRGDVDDPKAVCAAVMNRAYPGQLQKAAAAGRRHARRSNPSFRQDDDDGPLVRPESLIPEVTSGRGGSKVVKMSPDKSFVMGGKTYRYQRGDSELGYRLVVGSPRGDSSNFTFAPVHLSFDGSEWNMVGIEHDAVVNGTVSISRRTFSADKGLRGAEKKILANAINYVIPRLNGSGRSVIHAEEPAGKLNLGSYPSDSAIQTILIHKDHPKVRGSKKRAEAVAKKFRLIAGPDNAEESRNNFRFRQLDPRLFVPGSFRTFVVPNNTGVAIIFGRLKPSVFGMRLRLDNEACSRRRTATGKKRIRPCEEIWRSSTADFSVGVAGTRAAIVGGKKTATLRELVRKHGRSLIRPFSGNEPPPSLPVSGIG